jgi:acyl carrier protein
VPRTASGKVRRLELAARLAGGEFDAAIAATSLAAASARAPLSQTERKIAAIWADILNLPDCGRDEDFFELGGDSLSAEVLVLAIERQFGKRLPPQLLQGRTTIASLAVFVDGGPTVSAAAAGASTRRRTIARKRDAETLAWSLKVAKSLTASLFDRVYAVEFLVAYGMVEQAAAALRTLKAVLAQHRLSSPHVMDRLVAVTSRFRRMGIRQSVEKLGPLGQRLLSGSEESVLCAVPGGDRLLVVFNSMYGDFWVSTPVLHCLIRDERTNILYLKDPSERIFAGGLPAFGPDFDALVRGISETADKLGVGDIRVMGFSAGGYAALLAAARLNATAFAGFSIRTDLAPGSPLPGSQFATPENRVADDVYLDLEPILAAGTPKRAVLYYGENERADVLHAERLAHLPQFTLKRLPSTLHNTVLTLLAEGEFERAIRTLLH